MLVPVERGTQNGTLPDGSPPPVLSLLIKLTAGLTPDERTALARLLRNGRTD
jgi:hypothetical protein